MRGLRKSSPSRSPRVTLSTACACCSASAAPPGVSNGPDFLPLLVVATPIGNLDDITLRAISALRNADVVACEDTRHTRRLLERHGIAAPMTPYHEHNERAAAGKLLDILLRNKTVALVTNAGTPLVSDPGYRLVRAALDAGVKVEAIPGPSALTAAMSISGLPVHSFTFLGFPPRKPGKLRNFLSRHAHFEGTLV
ncbi:MAG TPA: rRNA small subunit methyltransferase 1, partial [Planctomycetes bacterium]|nr:rRNA small subunit methyltransferase 1 [Planctomycetota bacterium]